jgi:hypothetical protein
VVVVVVVGSVADLFPSSLKVFIKKVLKKKKSLYQKKKKNGVLLQYKEASQSLGPSHPWGGPPRAVVLTFGGGGEADGRPTNRWPAPSSFCSCRVPVQWWNVELHKKKRIPIIHPSGAGTVVYLYASV